MDADKRTPEPRPIDEDDLRHLSLAIARDLTFDPDDACDLAEWFLSSLWLLTHDARMTDAIERAQADAATAKSDALYDAATCIGRNAWAWEIDGTRPEWAAALRSTERSVRAWSEDPSRMDGPLRMAATGQPPRMIGPATGGDA